MVTKIRYAGVCCGFALLMALAGTAGAQSRSEGMPEALKNIKRADGVCRASDPFNADGAAPAAAPRPDYGCAIAAGVAQSMLQRRDTVLIDMRLASEHETFKVNGAILASLADLQSKPYWRAKTTILVGGGKAERELYSACAQLKKLGYKDVKVLRGGMPAWVGAQLPVLGKTPPLHQLLGLGPAELWLEAQNGDNLLLLAAGQKALLADLANAASIPEATAPAIRAVIERRRRAMKGAPLSAVVLAADAPMTEEQTLQLQQALQPVPLLIYHDTRAAYVKQLASQKAIWLAYARGPKQLGCGL